MLKNNGKEIFIAFIGAMLANIALMMIFYYLNVKQKMFAQLDVPRFTTVAVVLTPVVAGIICHARHKKKDDTAGAVIAVALITLAAAFIGSVCGAAMAAAAFGNRPHPGIAPAMRSVSVCGFQLFRSIEYIPSEQYSRPSYMLMPPRY